MTPAERTTYMRAYYLRRKAQRGPSPRSLITCVSCVHGATPHTRDEHALEELRRDVPHMFDAQGRWPGA